MGILPCLSQTPSHCGVWMGASSLPSGPLAWILSPHHLTSWRQTTLQAWLHLLILIPPLVKFNHPPTLRQWCYLLLLQFWIHHLFLRPQHCQQQSHSMLLLRIFIPFSVQAFFLLMIILLHLLAYRPCRHLGFCRVLKLLLDLQRAMQSANSPFNNYRWSSSKCKLCCSSKQHSCSICQVRSRHVMLLI